MTDVLDSFLRGDTVERLQLVSDPHAREQLRPLIRSAALTEYVTLSEGLGTRHLAPDAPPSVLFAPGVMGTLLDSEIKGGVWWIDVARTKQHLNDLGLSPDGTEDADPDSGLRPINVDTSYEPFLTAARHAPGIGLRTIPYDWRKLLTLSTKAFLDRVVELQDENGGRPIDLVAHSMGGLLIRAALMDHGKELWPRIGRIVFIGTPHYGSPAIAGYLKNHLWGFNAMALLGFYLKRPTFRSLWGVLSMLPAPVGVYPGTRESDGRRWPSRGKKYPHPCANFDMYDANEWHLDLSGEETSRLQTILDAAADFHRRMAEAHSRLKNPQLQRMLVIAGVGYKTLFRLERARTLFLWEHTTKVTDRVLGDPHREGDGRVPRASAELDDVRHCYVQGVHGGLPNIKAVYEAVFAFLQNGRIDLPTTPDEALVPHLGAAAPRSEAPALDGSSLAVGDDPGFFDLAADEAAAARNLAELERLCLEDVQLTRML